MSSKITNIALEICASADSRANNTALVFCNEAGMTLEKAELGELDSKSNAVANSLLEHGMKAGMRILFMPLQNCKSWYVLIALLKIGAVPVFLDAGVALSAAVDCLASMNVEGFVGNSASHIFRIACRRAFSHVKIKVTLDHLCIPGCMSVDELLRGSPSEVRTGSGMSDLGYVICRACDDGKVRAFECTEDDFSAGFEKLSAMYGLDREERCLALDYRYALLGLYNGCTVYQFSDNVLKNEKITGLNIYECLASNGIGALLGTEHQGGRLAEYCFVHGRRLSKLHNVVLKRDGWWNYRINGLFATFVLENEAEVFWELSTASGIPLCVARGRDVAKFADNDFKSGILGGMPMPDVRVMPCEAMETDQYLSGEICVCHKDGKVQHTGMAAYIAADGSLWIWGYLAHRLSYAGIVLYADCCEAAFDNMPGVVRSVLLQVTENKRNVMVVEPSAAMFESVSENAKGRMDALNSCAPNGAIEKVFYKRHISCYQGTNVVDRKELAAWIESCL